jgi:UPF0755 protein
MALKRLYLKNKPSRKIMIVFAVTGILLVVLLISGLRMANNYWGANIDLKNQKETFIYIPNDADFELVKTLIYREDIIIKKSSFEWAANFMGYTQHIKPGRYRVVNGMSNSALIKMLKVGHQAPVRLTFNNIRQKEKLAGIVSKKLEADSAEIVLLLNDEAFLKPLGVNRETALTLFIPDTYEFLWNTDGKGFVSRMKKEYDRFWNSQRVEKAKKLSMTQQEVMILASIVDEETIKQDEKPVVAGLYINRLKKGILLQADPTVKFANGNFQVNRILKKDLEIDSPYNTYKYAGLPPGPIRVASVSGIDAVLNAQPHDYYYMCAKEDFSGYHNFAKTLEQHNRNAAKYRRALKERNIWR